MSRKHLWNEQQSNEPSQISVKKGLSGLEHSWRLWRYCCCRYGWYPLLVSLIVTIGFFFSLYSAAGCDFIRVDIGFTPANTGWNSSTAELGLFLYQSGEEDTNKYFSFFLGGCRLYTEEFLDEFVDDDRTFFVSRIMAYVAIGASILATITSWLFVLSPLPAFFWPIFVLPALVTSTLAQGSMFLFYDTSICRKNVWFPPGTESLPRIAECSLGHTGTYGIASGIIFLLCLLLVCLKAPERRDLEPNYGLDVENGANPRKRRNIIRKDSSFDSDSEQVQYTYPVAPPPIGAPEFYPNEEDGESEFTMTSRGYDSGYESSVVGHGTHEIHDDYDDLVSPPKSLDHGDDDDKYNPRNPPATDVTIIRNRIIGNHRVVSRSRIETVQRMEKNTIDEISDTEIIDQLLTELDKSFNVDERDRQAGL